MTQWTGRNFREDFYMNLRSAERQIFNPTCVKHRNFDAHIATAKNCGTHWIKYMLSLALAECYGLPAPAHIQDESIVGHTKTKPSYGHIPQIATTHSHPHYLMRLPVFDVLNLPRFVVLVRDIRSILVSVYEKARGEHLDQKMGSHDVTFSQYLRGDVTGNTRIEDIWGLIRFFNAWGAIEKNNPENVLVLRYEDLTGDTLGALQTLRGYLNLDISDDILKNAIAKSSRRDMKDKIVSTENLSDKIVSVEKRQTIEWYSDEDFNFVRDVCARHLKYNFGYDYASLEQDFAQNPRRQHG